MSGPDTTEPVDFDAFAGDYDAALDRGISLSGESKDFFARRRVEWLHESLRGARPERVLDYGCGTGSTAPLLRSVLGATSVIGVDRSSEEIALARRIPGTGLSFLTLDEFTPEGDVDVVYCNGVFHHVPPTERARAIDQIRDSLKPGGIFSFWENNPWNPGTRLVMSRIPFDRDAILVSAGETRRLARAGGFEVLATHFLFVFPNTLRALRRLERPLASLPLGAQYQVLCRK
ncbi:MAG: class I SAM-dependent methyltransferase [Pseudomonadota bacterium]